MKKVTKSRSSRRAKVAVECGGLPGHHPRFMALTGKQRRYLRGLGHSLSANVLVGKEGISEDVAQTTRDQLRAHELVKIKLLTKNAPGDLDRHDAAEQLARLTTSEVAQVLGKTILLYRAREEEPSIALP